MTRPIRPPDDTGAFDLIGDVHGCIDELHELLTVLGYEIGDDAVVRHRDARRLILLGDLVDRGPAVTEVLKLAMASESAGTAFSVVGNHDDKLRRALIGRRVQITNGLAESLAQLEDEPEGLRRDVVAFIGAMPSHLILDGGRLIAAHAGLPRAFHGRSDDKTRDVAMFGVTTGKLDEDGLPVRINWAQDYQGPPAVAYGHTPVAEPVWFHDTIDLDTGCVFGHRLSALRWPEREIAWVRSIREYSRKGGPFRLVGPGGEKTSAAPVLTPRS